MRRLPIIHIRIVGLVALLLTVSLTVGAQDDRTVFDTIVSNDDPPPVEEEDPQYFSLLTDSLEVRKRGLPADAEKKFRDDEAFWYANYERTDKGKTKEVIRPDRPPRKDGPVNNEQPAIKEEKYIEREESPRRENAGVRLLLWILIIGVFVAALVMYLGNSNVGLFRKRNRGMEDPEPGEAIGEDIFAINYQSDIDKAAAQGHYRVAIRLLFLRLLKTMSEKQIIQYKQDKTNFDYLVELQPTRFYSNFFRVTRSYEYSWYGQFPVSEEGYKKIRNDFDQFDQELR